MQGCRRFKQCRNLPAMHYVAGVQAVKTLSEPTYWSLCRRLQAVKAVLERICWALCCSVGLLKQCQNLPPKLCGAGVQAVKAVSEPTSHALWGRGAGCLSSNRTYLRGTVLQGCRLFKWCRNLPPRHCVAGCSLFKQCPNLPAGLCVAGVQAVKAVLEPSSWALWGRGAGCLCGVGTYLPCTVGQGCSLFNRVGTYLLGTVEAVSVPEWNWILFYFNLRSDQVKPGHMQFLLLRSSFFF